MKPYVVCLMVSSIDGRIDCGMVDKISGDEYYEVLDALHCDASLEGRITAEHYHAMKGSFAVSDPTPVGSDAFFKAGDFSGWMIFTDTDGSLRYPAAEVDGKPILVMMAATAPREYADYLSDKGISWIAVGEGRLDLRKALDILSREFGVKRLALLGGGRINGGFLAAGLIDELNLLLAPGIDGRCCRVALFDGIIKEDFGPVKCKLRDLKRFDNDVIHLRYDIEKL